MPQRNATSEKPSTKRRSLNNKERQDIATKKLEAKVLVLEQIADGNRSPIDGTPVSMRALRDWVDPALGLSEIGSPSTTDPVESPHNAEFISKAYKAMKTIETLRAARKLRVYVPIAKKLADSKKENIDLKEENGRLASEALMFKHLYNIASGRLAKADEDKEIARRELNDLRVDYLNETNAKPRRVK